MRKLFVICSMALICLGCMAQANDSINTINTIKRDTSFIYGEATMKDAVEAKSCALAILGIKVADWVRSNYPKESVEICEINANENCLDLVASRGNYTRVLVYVAKNKIIPQREKKDLVEAQEDSVVLVEPIAVNTENVIQELTQEERDMLSISRFDEIEPYVNDLKHQGILRAYGKYASLPEDISCYLFVYDRTGQIVAKLHQKEEGGYTNLQSLTDDDIRNYKNCGAIWLQLK